MTTSLEQRRQNLRDYIAFLQGHQHTTETWPCPGCGKPICANCDHSAGVTGWGRTSWDLCNPEDAEDYLDRFPEAFEDRWWEKGGNQS